MYPDRTIEDVMRDEQRIRDQQNKASAEVNCGQTAIGGISGGGVLARLHSKRRALINRVNQIDHTIAVLESNRNFVEIYEAIQAAEGKADPFTL